MFCMWFILLLINRNWCPIHHRGRNSPVDLKVKLFECLLSCLTWEHDKLQQAGPRLTSDKCSPVIRELFRLLRVKGRLVELILFSLWCQMSVDVSCCSPEFTVNNKYVIYKSIHIIKKTYYYTCFWFTIFITSFQTDNCIDYIFI